jgi:hypothetical protein
MAKSKKARRARPRPAKSTSTVAESQATETAAVDSTVDQFQQEYAYVIKDLRRVFLLAAAMFILLVILNLVLQ